MKKTKIIIYLFAGILLHNNLICCAESNVSKSTPDIYIVTDNGNGESYGDSLTKQDGYVSVAIKVLSNEGEEILSAADGAGLIKIRGNSTSNGEKNHIILNLIESKIYLD